MQNKWNVTIKNFGSGQDGADDVFLYSDCVLEEEGDAVFINYDESGESGLDNTSTKIGISDGIVTITRTGDYSSSMIFQKGNEFFSELETPYGNLTFLIQTEDVKASVSENEIYVFLDYVIRSNLTEANDSDEISRCCVEIVCKAGS